MMKTEIISQSKDGKRMQLKCTSEEGTRTVHVKKDSILGTYNSSDGMAFDENGNFLTEEELRDIRVSKGFAPLVFR